MMKQILYILFVFFTFLTHAQNNHFVYDYKFKIDSLNRKQIDNEMMILETSKEGSKFYSYAKSVYDSAISAFYQNGKSDVLPNVQNSKVSFLVVKKYPEYKALFFSQIGQNTVVIESKDKLEWKIESDKSEILGYKVQKATTNFYGRKWEAWFTTEIPIHDGPYRFYGLPGLILKIEDSKGDHIFTLIGSKNSKVNFEYRKGNDDVYVTDEKFNKLWREYKNDPVKDMREFFTKDAKITINGNTMSGNEYLKQTEKERKVSLEKTNNFIELSLYK